MKNKFIDSFLYTSIYSAEFSQNPSSDFNAYEAKIMLSIFKIYITKFLWPLKDYLEKNISPSFFLIFPPFLLLGGFLFFFGV